MKKVLLSGLVFFIMFSIKGQNIWNYGDPNGRFINDGVIGSNKGIKPAIYADTTAANGITPSITGISFIEIYTITPAVKWHRSNLLDRWIVDSTGGVGGITALTGDITASGTGSVAATVVGIRTKVLPSLSTGNLRYNGSAFIFDNTYYTTAADSLAARNYSNLIYYPFTNPSNYISLSGLSATSPLFYNNSTGVISSQAATTSLNGYLTSTDWNTFNGKLSSNQAVTVTATGDASGVSTSSGTAPSLPLVLATVNSSPGTTGDASHTSAITTNGKGLVTANTTTSIQIAESQVTNLVSDLAGKQSTLVSGTNIKTVNGSSLLGSGNLSVAGSTIYAGYGLRKLSDSNTLSVDTNYIANKTVDVFLFAGQSNIRGVGTSSLSPVPDTTAIFQYSPSTGVTGLIDPVGTGWNQAVTGSMIPSFGITYNRSIGHRVCVIPYGISNTNMVTGGFSSSVGYWDASGTLRDTAVLRVNSAITALKALGYTPVFKGIVWGQGENDAAGLSVHTETQSQYYNALKTMITFYRANMPTGIRMPFYIIRTGFNTVGNDIAWDSIRVAQDSISNRDSSIFVVYKNTVNFAKLGWMNSDSIHYNQVGQNDIGRTVANVVIDNRTFFNSANKNIFFTENQVGLGVGASYPIADLDISSGGTTIAWGASNNSRKRVNNDNKVVRVGTVPYANGGLLTANIVCTTSNSTTGTIINGGSSAMYAGTFCDIYTAGGIATTTGTKVIHADSAQIVNVLVGLTVGSVAGFKVNASGAISASTGIATSGGYTQSGSTANTFTGATTVPAFTATGALSITAGSNKSTGTATLVGGTVTVSNTRVTASSIIFLTDATTGALTNIGTPTVGTIVAGTSFVINSSNVLDASNINWIIIN